MPDREITSLEIAREVVAEKDAEIARLKARANRLGESYKLMAEDNAELHKRLREPRKVSDTQRKLDEIKKLHVRNGISYLGCELCGAEDGNDWPCSTLKIIESLADAEATT